MALKINDDCINCHMCIVECPNDAIFMGKQIYEIAPERCTECVGHYDAPSCASVCPVECIIPDPVHRESLAALTDKYSRLHC